MAARKLAIAVILILLAACEPSPYSPTLPGQQFDPAAQATLGYRAAEDAAATYQAFSAEATAAANSATRNVLVVTETAQAIASATSGAATGTAESQLVRMTEASMAVEATGTALFQSIDATRQSVSVQATATAEARKALNDAVLAADEARRQMQQREADALRLQQQAMWNNIWPFLVAIGMVVFVVLAAVAGISMWKRMQVDPIQIITANGHEYPLVQSGQQWQMLPQPRLPNYDPVMLPDGNHHIRPQPVPPLPDGHVLILAETDGGKSTTMRAIIKARQNVIVLDPHYTAGDWLDAQVIGGGRDFGAIINCLDEVFMEMNRRFQVLKDGPATFPPITVVTDEVPAIMQSEYGREAKEIWPKLVREARKVDLFIVISTQSTRVKTMGIEGEKDVLENFKHSFILGRMAMDMYPELTDGMERPAVLRSGYDSPKPVIIPYVPEEDPKNPAFRRASSDRAPLFVASSGTRRSPGIETAWGYISGDQVETILQMKREGASGRAIEEEVFGYAGGYAYNMVKAVLEQYATATGA
jgi:hypothetical protein